MLSSGPFPEKIDFESTETALANVDKGADLNDSEFFELLHMVRLKAQELHTEYLNVKNLHEERAELIVDRVEKLLEQSIAVLREHSFRFILPDGVEQGRFEVVSLDAYQTLGHSISMLEEYRDSLRLPFEDDWDD